MLTISIVNDKDTVLISKCGQNEVFLVYDKDYNLGDKVVIETSEKDMHVVLQVDDALGSSLVYLKTTRFVYEIPFGEKKYSYSPKSFIGNKHYITLRIATKEEVLSYRNLACNVYDQHGDTQCYPHATANVETRGEAVFAARNAIDNVIANDNHGKWPYSSWGINRQSDAEIIIDFGRKVLIDRLVLYTRADFPHDSWWTRVKVTFSDGSVMLWDMEKSALPHVKEIEQKQISWIKLSDLIKAEDDSPFPALTQFQVYGKDVDFE